MHFLLRMSLTLCLLFVLIAPSFARAQSDVVPAVVLNELGLWPLEGDVRWIELANIGSTPVDVGDWMLKRGDEVILALSPSVVGAGEFRVLFEGADEAVAWPGEVTELSLYDGAGVLVDTVPWASSLSAGQSLARAGDSWLPSYLATAGRPNVVADKDLVCPVEESEPEPDPLPETPVLATTGNVRINELLPDPDGDETQREFIEIYNNDVQPVRLQGWKLSDPSKTFVLGDITIAPQQYWVFYRSESGITLNNDKDDVYLTDAAGTVLHHVSYASNSAEKSWNYGSEWYQATPTPNDVNSPFVAPVTPQQPTTPPPAVQPPPVTTPTDPEPAPAVVEEPDAEALATIRLSEVYPVPGEGEAEWIEIVNTSSESVALTGLSISDGVRTFTFTDQMLSGGAFLVVPQSVSNIQLNNGGDHVMLLIGDVILDETTYAAMRAGTSWVKMDETWIVSESPTPGQAETEAEPQAEEGSEDPATGMETKEETVPAPKASVAGKKATLHQPITFKQWPGVASKSLVQIEGVIAIAPSTMKKRTAFLQPLQGEAAGIELYFSKAEPEDLAVGDVVSVSGEKSISSLGDRLLVRAPEDVEVTASTEVEVSAAAWSERDKTWNNQLIAVNGIVAAATAKGMELEQNGEHIKVAYKSYKPERSPEPGDEVQVTGLYRSEDDEIWVHQDDMIAVVEQPEVVTAASAPQEPATLTDVPVPTAKPENSFNWMYVLGTAGAGGVASWYLSADSAKRALQLVTGFLKK